jgi:hypothetical protein
MYIEEISNKNRPSIRKRLVFNPVQQKRYSGAEFSYIYFRGKFQGKFRGNFFPTNVRGKLNFPRKEV